MPSTQASRPTPASTTPTAVPTHTGASDDRRATTSTARRPTAEPTTTVQPTVHGAAPTATPEPARTTAAAPTRSSGSRGRCRTTSARPTTTTASPATVTATVSPIATGPTTRALTATSAPRARPVRRCSRATEPARTAAPVGLDHHGPPRDGETRRVEGGAQPVRHPDAPTPVGVPHRPVEQGGHDPEHGPGRHDGERGAHDEGDTGRRGPRTPVVDPVQEAEPQGQDRRHAQHGGDPALGAEATERHGHGQEQRADRRTEADAGRRPVPPAQQCGSRGHDREGDEQADRSGRPLDRCGQPAGQPEGPGPDHGDRPRRRPAGHQDGPHHAAIHDRRQQGGDDDLAEQHGDRRRRRDEAEHRQGHGQERQPGAGRRQRAARGRPTRADRGRGQTGEDEHGPDPRVRIVGGRGDLDDGVEQRPRRRTDPEGPPAGHRDRRLGGGQALGDRQGHHRLHRHHGEDGDDRAGAGGHEQPGSEGDGRPRRTEGDARGPDPAGDDRAQGETGEDEGGPGDRIAVDQADHGQGQQPGRRRGPARRPTHRSGHPLAAGGPLVPGPPERQDPLHAEHGQQGEGRPGPERQQDGRHEGQGDAGAPDEVGPGRCVLVGAAGGDDRDGGQGGEHGRRADRVGHGVGGEPGRGQAQGAGDGTAPREGGAHPGDDPVCTGVGVAAGDGPSDHGLRGEAAQGGQRAPAGRRHHQRGEGERSAGQAQHPDAARPPEGDRPRRHQGEAHGPGRATVHHAVEADPGDLDVGQPEGDAHGTERLGRGDEISATAGDGGAEDGSGEPHDEAALGPGRQVRPRHGGEDGHRRDQAQRPQPHQHLGGGERRAGPSRPPGRRPVGTGRRGRRLTRSAVRVRRRRGGPPATPGRRSRRGGGPVRTEGAGARSAPSGGRGGGTGRGGRPRGGGGRRDGCGGGEEAVDDVVADPAEVEQVVVDPPEGGAVLAGEGGSAGPAAGIAQRGGADRAGGRRRRRERQGPGHGPHRPPSAAAPGPGAPPTRSWGVRLGGGVRRGRAPARGRGRRPRPGWGCVHRSRPVRRPRPRPSAPPGGVRPDRPGRSA